MRFAAIHILKKFLLVYCVLCMDMQLSRADVDDRHVFSVSVVDKVTGEPLVYPNCFLRSEEGGRKLVAGGDMHGVCRFYDLPDGVYGITVLYMGEMFDCGKMTVKSGLSAFTVKINIKPILIDEAVVIATEPRGSVTKSVVGVDAMKHLQPSSIADVLELIPGGRATDPAFSSAQIVSLREASVPGSNYTTSSLGTQFTMDGIPLSTNANLQSTPAYSSYGGSFVNQGVDMRSISADDIESVEVVRGIASAEYGDLTSGMVNIKRRRGGRDLTARFKSDMKSKLFYVGKGFETSGTKDPVKINIGAGYLDTKADPRNTRQNYRRLSASFRVNRSWTGNDDFVFSAGGSFDYSGSFDNAKSDLNLDFGTHGPVERYKSQYNRFALSGDFRLSSRRNGFFRRFDLKAAVSADMDVIDRWKYVALGSEVPLSTAREEGEYNVEALPAKYEASMKIEGIPFNAFFKSTAHFRFGGPKFGNNLLAGAEWSMDKNYGRGLVFDVTRPFSPDMNVRPRAFNSIPAMHQFSLYAEDNMSIVLGSGFRLDAMLGLRASMLLNLSGAYDLSRKVFADPRVNATLYFPSFDLDGGPFEVSLSGGFGMHTKFPTLDYLYPEYIYYDIPQMNFWPADPEKRLVNLKVFKIDPVNHALDAAINLKWEIRGDFSWKDNSLSVTYFREDMTSGFRYQGRLVTFVTKDYDEQSVDPSQLTGPPDLSNVPYVLDTLLTTYSVPDNGSRTLKEGVEFSFVSARIRPIRTRIIVTGAWFRTVYRNSLPDFYRPLSNVGGKTYPYIGYYAETDGYLREMFNTNFTFDTQIPRLGLIFTTSFQCLWFTGSQTLYVNPYPEYYIDNSGTWHEFTDESAENDLLAQLIQDSDPSVFRYNTVPFSMNVNLKVTKTLFRDKLSLSVFVNKILDVTPAYRTSAGVLVRRSVHPYFGMELNFKI